MDTSEQPEVLRVLRQVEEMLIERVNPILQVSHARGGQYRYSGHTISFPQDISTIANKHPRRVEQIYYVIVRICGVEWRYCVFYVKRQCVMDAFHYKIEMDKY